MISVVILNWLRPSNLKDTILPALERYSSVSEIIISHGKKETAFDYKSEQCRIVHRKDWGEVNDTYGLARRWIAGKYAANEIVMDHDDDLLISEDTLEKLLHHYLQRPNVIHGLFGRQPSTTFRYDPVDHHGDVLLNCTFSPSIVGVWLCNVLNNAIK